MGELELDGYWPSECNTAITVTLTMMQVRCYSGTRKISFRQALLPYHFSLSGCMSYPPLKLDQYRSPSLESKDPQLTSLRIGLRSSGDLDKNGQISHHGWLQFHDPRLRCLL